MLLAGGGLFLDESDHSGTLDPYVPRVLLRWLAETPDRPLRSVRGTVAFIDISGFTRLSERLAKTGKEGAEHLSETINACFSTLLADAYANGGGLLKFGGDALLLWFEGAGHATRACRFGRSDARVAASDRLDQHRQRHRPAADSIGVHSGIYDMFLVGRSHRELVIAGPAASQVVAMEAIASTGQILVSQDLAVPLLPPRCLGAERGPGVLLKQGPPVAPVWTEADRRRPHRRSHFRLPVHGPSCPRRGRPC